MRSYPAVPASESVASTVRSHPTMPAGRDMARAVLRRKLRGCQQEHERRTE